MGTEIPEGDGTVLNSDYGGDYTTVCICQNLQNNTLSIMCPHYILRKMSIFH